MDPKEVESNEFSTNYKHSIYNEKDLTPAEISKLRNKYDLSQLLLDSSKQAKKEKNKENNTSTDSLLQVKGQTNNYIENRILRNYQNKNSLGNNRSNIKNLVSNLIGTEISEGNANNTHSITHKTHTETLAFLGLNNTNNTNLTNITDKNEKTGVKDQTEISSQMKVGTKRYAISNNKININMKLKNSLKNINSGNKSVMSTPYVSHKTPSSNINEKYSQRINDNKEGRVNKETKERELRTGTESKYEEIDMKQSNNSMRFK
eukprot:CAMPEP_0170539544 /NCGR_PEP_ID=MMETSP0209-20121228/104008_1 /TAXON_ID=665100 ORGANISM="Litonotus pictus, Strain P1" /NCGR_SAMPLE_ID=MMETSP0209 /ASSEMBLY_ACC=CAM_ASM_000301 /LENGTH=261 /DNA_ID=CAMNT_0010841523 /DNA_START=1280 /DNA_END=2062 /DNA_ORIENTATION=-